MFIKKYIPKYGILLSLESPRHPEWIDDHYLKIEIPRIHPYLDRTLLIIVSLSILGIIANWILTGQVLL